MVDGGLDEIPHHVAFVIRAMRRDHLSGHHFDPV
jgi:hypothetical protein